MILSLKKKIEKKKTEKKKKQILREGQQEIV